VSYAHTLAKYSMSEGHIEADIGRYTKVVKVLVGHGWQLSADAPVQEFCPKLHSNQSSIVGWGSLLLGLQTLDLQLGPQRHQQILFSFCEFEP
jgi:hypothetical protein